MTGRRTAKFRLTENLIESSCLLCSAKTPRTVKDDHDQVAMLLCETFIVRLTQTLPMTIIQSVTDTTNAIRRSAACRSF